MENVKKRKLFPIIIVIIVLVAAIVLIASLTKFDIYARYVTPQSDTLTAPMYIPQLQSTSNTDGITVSRDIKIYLTSENHPNSEYRGEESATVYDIWSLTNSTSADKTLTVAYFGGKTYVDGSAAVSGFEHLLVNGEEIAAEILTFKADIPDPKEFKGNTTFIDGYLEMALHSESSENDTLFFYKFDITVPAGGSTEIKVTFDDVPVTSLYFPFGKAADFEYENDGCTVTFIPHSENYSVTPKQIFVHNDLGLDKNGKECTVTLDPSSEKYGMVFSRNDSGSIKSGS